MLIVARWSATEDWKTMFCSLRSSPACFMLTVMSLTSDSRPAISALRVSMVLVSAWCFCARSSLRCSPSVMVSSVSSICFLQNSSFALSSFCCFSNSASILSIASLTLVKVSSRMRTASAAIAQLRWRRANSAMRFMERSTAMSWAAVRPDASIWMKLIVLAYKSRASSAVKIVKASPSARISSERTAARSLYSLSSTSHVSRMLPRKPLSAARASAVVTLSSFALAVSSKFSANCASFDSFCSDAALSSASFAARSFWNATSDSRSCLWAVARSFPTLSFISRSIPRTPPLRELYDLEPAALPSSGALGWPTCRAPSVASPPARPFATSVKEPSKSKRSCCMMPRKPPARFSARASWT
mmetsp:Transcript_53415/g.167099  ORF Transcript_53415/g.167099 Transcript_53415/m.167099 type:complete len:359 (-) Transcript_53415:507-1583(-)